MPTLKIKINGDIVNRNDKLSYECPNCHKINNIGVDRFLSKKSENCPKCKELLEHLKIEGK